MPEKNIKLAKYAGFCYGVKRAVETVKKLKAENPDKNVFVLGELIHNTQVIHELEKLGIKTLTEIPEQGDGICVIRSHGESPEVIENIKKVTVESYFFRSKNLLRINKLLIIIIFLLILLLFIKFSIINMKITGNKCY